MREEYSMSTSRTLFLCLALTPLIFNVSQRDTMRRKIKLLFLSQKLCPNLYNACSWPTFLSKEILCNISCLSKAGTHTHVLAVFQLVLAKKHRHIHTERHTSSDSDVFARAVLPRQSGDHEDEDNDDHYVVADDGVADYGVTDYGVADDGVADDIEDNDVLAGAVLPGQSGDLL